MNSYSPISKFRSIAGVTLMELMIVIAIVGIMAVVGQVSVAGMLNNSRLKAAVSIVRSSLYVARTRAMANPAIHCGVFLETTKKGIILFYDDNADNNYTANTDRIYQAFIALPPTLLFGTISGITNNCIIFRGDGSAKLGGSFQIKLPSGTTLKTITISKESGEVTVAP